MSILVTENWSERNVTYGAGVYRASRIFIVTGVTTQSAAIAAVVAFDGTAAYNAGHPQSSLMYVDNQACDPSGFNVWRVVITYSSTPAGRHPNPGNPLAEPISYRFQWGSVTQGCDRDAYGNVIQNTANESFSTLAPTDVLNGWLICRRNEPFYNASLAVAYSNAVNSATVSFNGGSYTLLKGQACVRTVTPITEITSASTYVTVEYAIELRKGYRLDSDGYYDGFKIRIENTGKRGYYNSGGVKSGPIGEISQGVFQNVSFPVRLDANGKPMQPAGSPYYIGTGSSYATPVNSPTPLPSTTVIENAGDAYFVKYFPETVSLLNLAALGL